MVRHLMASVPGRVEIVYTGLRPGEKLHEVLLGRRRAGRAARCTRSSRTCRCPPLEPGTVLVRRLHDRGASHDQLIDRLRAAALAHPLDGADGVPGPHDPAVTADRAAGGRRLAVGARRRHTLRRHRTCRVACQRGRGGRAVRPPSRRIHLSPPTVGPPRARAPAAGVRLRLDRPGGPRPAGLRVRGRGADRTAARRRRRERHGGAAPRAGGGRGRSRRRGAGAVLHLRRQREPGGVRRRPAGLRRQLAGDLDRGP